MDPYDIRKYGDPLEAYLEEFLNKPETHEKLKIVPDYTYVECNFTTYYHFSGKLKSQ